MIINQFSVIINDYSKRIEGFFAQYEFVSTKVIRGSKNFKKERELLMFLSVEKHLMIFSRKKFSIFRPFCVLGNETLL